MRGRTRQRVPHVEGIAQQQRASRMQRLASHLQAHHQEGGQPSTAALCCKQACCAALAARHATCPLRTCLFCMHRMRPFFTAASKCGRSAAGTCGCARWATTQGCSWRCHKHKWHQAATTPPCGRA